MARPKGTQTTETKKTKETTEPPATLSFETAMQRLETIVGRLESGEALLEESLQLFEEGIKLTRYCTGQLDAAEGKIQVLLGYDGKEPQLGEFGIKIEEN
jgi:exodeoxyribonuclease VII small subunit